MIVSMIKRLFSSTVYVQLRENQIKITHVEEKSVYEQRPFIAIDRSKSKKEIVHAIGNSAYDLRLSQDFEVSNPFSHPRVLVSSFVKAEKVLMHGIREVHKSKFLSPSPVVIMHPMEKLEGGMTDIEVRVLRELALGAGAREVHLHVGNELNINSFSLDQVRAPTSV